MVWVCEEWDTFTGKMHCVDWQWSIRHCVQHALLLLCTHHAHAFKSAGTGGCWTVLGRQIKCPCSCENNISTIYDEKSAYMH